MLQNIQRPGIICVGLGPGSADLLTQQAARVLSRARRVAYFHKSGAKSRALAIAESLLPSDTQHIAWTYPLTTERESASAEYRSAMRDFYDGICHQIVAIFDENSTKFSEDCASDLIVLCEGDPMLYGSFLHLHRRLRLLAPHIPVQILAAVPAMAGAWHAAAQPMTLGNEALALIPATLPPERIAAIATQAQALVLIKAGRQLPKIRQVLENIGRLPEALLIENAQTPEQRIRALRDLTPEERAPYFSLVLVPGPAWAQWPEAAATPTTSAAAEPSPAPTPAQSHARGQLHIVGLGPGPTHWTTPAAAQALAQCSHVLGYARYVAQAQALIEENSNQNNGFSPKTWLASDNRQELDRARHALDLAVAGHSVALVCSGDAGVFAMAAAVFEAIDFAEHSKKSAWLALDIQIHPGITAALAAASRVGAPLGQDFCCINLSDNLKPWSLLQRRLELALQADFAIALYNPRSQARPHALDAALTIVRDFDAQRIENSENFRRPIIFAHAVGTASERIEHADALSARGDMADMRTLVIIAAAPTRRIERGAEHAPWLYAPRRSEATSA